MRLLSVIFGMFLGLGVITSANATIINFDFSVPFVNPPPPGAVDRYLTINGSFDTIAPLDPNGTINIGDISAFNAVVELGLKFGSLFNPFLTADFTYGLGDINTFMVTLLGGEATGVSVISNLVPQSGGSLNLPGYMSFVLGFANGEVVPSVYYHNSLENNGVLIGGSAVPEPAAVALFCLGLAGLAIGRRRYS